MIIIDPIPVTNTALTSSSVAESDFSQWAASTTYAAGDYVMETSPSATVTMTIASPCVITWTNHGRADDTPIVFTTTGALPAGLTAGVEYFVNYLTADTFTVSEEAGGVEVNTSGSQSGTHTATARVHTVYKSLVGSRSTVTMTIATPCVVSWAGHGLVADTPISFTTTGALPTGLVASTVYYVKSPTTDTFNLAATAGGSAINTSGSQSGTHTATATLAVSFSKKPATNTTQWAVVGKTNRWKMFDESNSSQTENADSIAVVIGLVGVGTAVYIGNADVDSVTFTMTDATEGVVYTETQSSALPNSGSSFYNWFFKRIQRKRNFVSLALPPYGNASLSVTLTKTGGIAKCGVCSVGPQVDIGVSLSGLGTDIKDYSTVMFDQNGNTTTTERGYVKRMSLDVLVDNEQIDPVQDLLADYRQKVVVWIGDETSLSACILGKFESFKNVISYPTVSKMALNINGVV